jgi:undecaprenyl-diphosphatase
VNLFQAVVYGIVQGLSEFLPISSSGHLRIVPALFGWEDPGAAFSAVIQIGTMLAIVVYFWRELTHVAFAWVRGLFDHSVRGSLEYRLGWYLLLATIPVGVFGFLFRNQIETGARNLWLIASTLIVMALVLLLAERTGTRTRKEEDINRNDAIVVGTAQALALIPGVSRSGATITAGLFRGLNRETAARFSFLMSVPAVVASGLFEARHIGDEGGPGMGVTVLATIFSFIVGLATIAWLIKYISKHSTMVFIVYRIALGLLLFLLLSIGAISAT